MLDEGYAAVSIRRLGAKVGVNSALVSYYFGSMDGLFVELFRRGAERSLHKLTEALRSPQPLWALWDLTHDYSGNALTMEFLALSNHRKAIRSEIAAYSTKFRTLQLETLSDVLRRHGVDLDRWPAVSLILAMAGISRYLHMEEAFGVDIGHRETIAVIEREIRTLEGERRPAGEQTVVHPTP